MIQKITLDQVNELKKWDDFVLSHPEGTPSHLSGWLKTIHSTYNFKPILYVLKNQKNHIQGVFPCFFVKSVLTGSRLVSLPFSDYGGILCDPNISKEEFSETVTDYFKSVKYVEVRGTYSENNGFMCNNHYKRHALNLKGNIDNITKNINKKTIFYSIRKAKKNDVIITEENTELGIEEFYRLNMLTRKKHGIPGQPLKFFENLYEHMIADGNGFILLANKNSRVIGASLFLICKDKIHYKYNASDPDYIKKVSPNHLLTWHAIEKGNAKGYRYLDFGRTSPDNEGLMRYKEMWGMQPIDLPYYYYPEVRGAVSTEESSFFYTKITQVWRSLPNKITERFGPVVYRHMA